MRITARTLNGFALRGTDGDEGTIGELYFDDRSWTVRYLVADAGARLVLISPHALLSVDREERRVSVGLTREQIDNSPSWDSDKPVSRQFEEAYNTYYGWPMYWNGPFVLGPFPDIDRDRGEASRVNAGGKDWDPRLRSTADVRGYNIHASDGEIGHVDDFSIDVETWAILDLIVDTRNWLPGRKVLVSPRWITSVSWSDAKVYVDLLRETVKSSPEYSDDAPAR